MFRGLHIYISYFSMVQLSEFNDLGPAGNRFVHSLSHARYVVQAVRVVSSVRRTLVIPIASSIVIPNLNATVSLMVTTSIVISSVISIIMLVCGTDFDFDFKHYFDCKFDWDFECDSDFACDWEPLCRRNFQV